MIMCTFTNLRISLYLLSLYRIFSEFSIVFNYFLLLFLEIFPVYKSTHSQITGTIGSGVIFKSSRLSIEHPDWHIADCRSLQYAVFLYKENPVACFSRQATGFHYTDWGSGFAANLSTCRPCRRPGLRLPWRRRPWGRACRRPGIRSSGRRRRWTRRSPERCA